MLSETLLRFYRDLSVFLAFPLNSARFRAAVRTRFYSGITGDFVGAAVLAFFTQAHCLVRLVAIYFATAT